jgi:hypothetical protein
MGQQQLLLIILGVIIVGIAIVVGIWMFSGTSVSSNRDAIINDLMNISQFAQRYKLRPEPLGGGGYTYNGFSIPQSLRSNDNASYSAQVNSADIVFTATSTFGFGTVVVPMDSTGTLGTYVFTGDFQ